MVSRLLRIGVLVVLGMGLAWIGGTSSARAERVDLQLVLAADVSRSVDAEEFKLQREGYATAFNDPRVLRAIKSGGLGKIAVCYVEWSGEWAQQVVVDWTVIEDEESAAGFAASLLRMPRPFADRTSIGVAIDFAVGQFGRSGHESRRRTIDVSGDGTNTNGKAPALARDQAVALGIVVNGLVILSPEPMPWNPMHTHPPGGLDNYYRENVAGGPGSFVMVVEDFQSFAFAIANKLIREIAEAPAPAGALTTVGGRAMARGDRAVPPPRLTPTCRRRAVPVVSTRAHPKRKARAVSPRRALGPSSDARAKRPARIRSACWRPC